MKSLIYLVILILLNANCILATNIYGNVELSERELQKNKAASSSNDLIIRLLLYDFNSTPFVNFAIDGFVLVYSGTSSNCVNSVDGTKIPNLAENIFMQTDDDILSFQFRETPSTNTNEVEDIHLTGLTDTQYKFGVQFLEDQGLSNFPNGVLLWDKYLDTFTSISDGDVINFSVDYSIPLSFSQTRFAFVFNSNPTINDNVFNAIELGVNNSSAGDEYKLTNATSAVDEPDTNFTDGINNSVWFSFVAPANGAVSISTDIPGGTLTDSEIAVYSSGSCSADFSNFSQIGYDDNSGLYNPNSSILNLTGLSAGQTYFIQVDSSNSSPSGTFGIEVRELFLYDDLNGFTPFDPNGINAPDSVFFVENGTYNLSLSTVLHHVTIGHEAVLDIDANLNADVYFKSSASGSAQLADATGAAITGQVTVERFIPSGNRAHRFLSTAVTTSGSIRQNWQENVNNTGLNYPTDNQNPFPGYGTHISGDISGNYGFDATSTGNPSMFTFNNSFSGNQNNAWVAISETNTQSLVAGTPYLVFIRGDRSINLNDNSAMHTQTTLRASGNIFIGNQSQNLSQIASYFSLVANPYQAIVDFNSLTFGGDVNSNFFFVFNPNAGTNGLYETIDSATPAQQMIQPGQSFFVQNLPNLSNTASLEFTESAKNTSGNLTSVFEDNNLLIANLELYNNEGIKMDVLKMRFQADADNGIDDFDADKFYNPTENLSSASNNIHLSVERRGIPQEQDIIPLSLTQHQSSEYQFKIELDNWDHNIKVFIQDNYLDNFSAISANQNYEFSVDTNIMESIAPDRFNLVFKNTTLSLQENIFGVNFSLYPNPTSDYFSIKTPNLSGEVSVEMTNVLGQSVYTKKLKVTDNQVEINASNLSQGIYMVKLMQGDQSYTSKLILN